MFCTVEYLLENPEELIDLFRENKELQELACKIRNRNIKLSQRLTDYQAKFTNKRGELKDMFNCIDIKLEGTQQRMYMTPENNFLFDDLVGPYRELVGKNKPQYISIIIMNYDDSAELIQEQLKLYLEQISGKSIKCKLVQKEGNDFELVASVVVDDYEEVKLFISSFKKYLISENLNNLARMITDDDITYKGDLITEPNTGQYNYSDAVFYCAKNGVDFTHISSTGILRDSGYHATIGTVNNNYYITINNIKEINDNSVNNSHNSTITGFYNTVIEKKNPRELFIEHIKENKPEWFVPDTWISIGTFYERYLTFDNSANIRSFATKFKDILWSHNEQKWVNEIKSKKIHYRLMDLW
jgi:hypothetical protein